MPTKKTDEYQQNVFINCPFDDDYQPIFEAIVFTVMIVGFRPKCARERMNSAEVRIQKIVSIIGDCRYSVHDLSRTQLDDSTGLPRFNMPFELGVDVGCREFSDSYNDKSCLIFGEKKYEYHKYLSDISGQDIAHHDNEVKKAVAGVRDFLATAANEMLLGPAAIFKRYEMFRERLPAILEAAGVNSDEMKFVDLTLAIKSWLETLPAEGKA